MRQPQGYEQYRDKKPPIVVVPRLHAFTCEECGQPGESLSPIAKTHPGACHDQRVRRQMAKANARMKQRRAEARAGKKA